VNEIFERPAVVVGVDGSEQNEAAVEYAAAEAAASGRALLLVTVVVVEGPASAGQATDHFEATLNEVRDRIAARHDGLSVRTVVQKGHPVEKLLATTGDGDVLVVGKRGLGRVKRLLVGSTSVRCAGRAEVPVIVVPPGWEAGHRATGPVVVGIDPEHEHGVALRFAFERAQRTGTAVRVVYAVDMDLVMVFGAGAVSSASVHDWESGSMAAIEQAVAPLRAEFPDVEVDTVHERAHAADVLVERSTDAQLVVVSRRHRGPASWGLGSVAREVLHEAELPVAVVPQPEH
jgi:nucleotide-binding universal stress UspA family protein